MAVTVRVFDCPTLGRQDWGPSMKYPPLEKIAGVLCECFETHLASAVNLRDEEALES